MTASGDLYRLADGLGAAEDAALERVKVEAARIVLTVGARYVGGGGMKGKKRRGLTVAMSKAERVEHTGPGATFLVQGTVPAWIWLTSGTRAHRIPRRRRGKLHRLILTHPGMAGRGAWRQVAAQLHAQVPPLVVAEMERRVLGG